MRKFRNRRDRELYSPAVLDDFETRALQNPTSERVSEESYYWQLVRDILSAKEKPIAAAPGHAFSPSKREPLLGLMYLTNEAFIWLPDSGYSSSTLTSPHLDLGIRVPLEEIIDWQPGKAWAEDMPGNSYFIAYRDPEYEFVPNSPGLPKGARILWYIYPLKQRTLDFCATFYDFLEKHGGWEGKFGTLGQ